MAAARRPHPQVAGVPRRRVNYSELPGFIAVAIALLGSPGPATLSLAAVGAAYAFKDC